MSYNQSEAARNVLIAPDSFKDCLPALDVAQCIADGIRETKPGAAISLFPMADGGDGTARCLHYHKGGRWINVPVHDPLHRIIQSSYLIIDKEDTAVIEMASASGLELLKKNERDPLKTSTFGTGELIRHALSCGVQKIILTIGGSATVDGGAGMAAALGFRFPDAGGKELHAQGMSLNQITHIDANNVLPALQKADILIASDVQNILNGEQGAAVVYGPQKGAGPEAIGLLRSGLQNISNLVYQETGFEADMHPGTGAAGGIALFLLAYTKANIIKGFDLIAEMTGLQSAIKLHNVVITGEGRIDRQTSYGKVVSGIAEMVKSIPDKYFAGVAGKIEGDIIQIKKTYGMDEVHSIRELAVSDHDSIQNAAYYLKTIGKKIVLPSPISKP